MERMAEAITLFHRPDALSMGDTRPTARSCHLEEAEEGE